MKSAAHQYEDKLLEFAYGELPQHEADAVDAHVRGCNRCSASLSEIRGVRATMAQLPMEAAPDAGLESLLAYAEQAAKRTHQKTAPSIWKRILMPLASLAALATVGVVGFRANQEFDTSPASAVATTKVEERAERAELAEKMKAGQGALKSQPTEQLAQKQQPQAVAVPPVVAAVAPAPDPTSIDAPRNDKAKEAQKKEGKAEGKADGKNAAALDDLVDSRQAASGELGGKRANVWGPEPKVVPQSVARRELETPKPVNDSQVYRDNDYSNAAARGGLTKDVTKAAPPPPPAAQDKAAYGGGFGLGSPGASQGSTGAKGNEDAPQGVSANKPSPAKEPVAEKAAEVQVKEESKKRAKASESERVSAEEPAPAPVAPMAMPSTAMPSAPSKKKNDGYGIRPQMGSSSPSSIGNTESDEAVMQSDRLGVDSDAKYQQRKRAESVTQSVESARVASSRGDRLSEIRLLAQALQNGATGYERVEALKRICDAYEALGEVERADPFCDQLLQEFPNTVAAKAVSDRRKSVQRAAPAPAPKRPAAIDRKTMDFQEAGQPKPADAPAQAY